MKVLQLNTGKVLWEGKTLTRADLGGADLCGADLRGADLCGADLCGADLCGANLSSANLSSANLCGANLSGANLSSADLCGADLRGADLCGADLRGANLIVGGCRSDGYQFLLYKELTGTLMVRAGCRYLSIKDARNHWRTTRAGTRLGLESLALVDCLEACAKAAGWET